MSKLVKDQMLEDEMGEDDVAGYRKKYIFDLK